MAQLGYPVRTLGLAGAALPVAAPMPYTGTRLLVHSAGLQDFRLAGDSRGSITANNRVMVKPEPTAPEVPFAGARVRLHRLLDGYCAWEGISDAQGYYWPRGLEVGLWYYPVAIDLTGTHECDAAGPVQAVREGG